MPKYHVTRFQVMAEISAEITRSWVATSGGTIPRPTVLATAVPVSAPTTLRMAAMATALPGVSTRVATDVAMAFAVSWNPLMKSKASARATTTINARRAGSGILEYDSLHRVRHALGAIGRVLEQLVQLAPADRSDEGRDILNAIVEDGECLAQRVVRLVLQPVDLDRVTQDTVPLLRMLQPRDRLGEDLSLF